MWELDHKEGRALKNWCFLIVMLEMTLENPLGSKEIKAVNPKGNQFWIFTGRTDAEAEAPILRLPDVKSWLIGKDPDVAKDWRQEEKVPSGDLPGGPVVENPPHNAGDAGSVPGQGAKIPGDTRQRCCNCWAHWLQSPHDTTRESAPDHERSHN